MPLICFDLTNGFQFVELLEQRCDSISACHAAAFSQYSSSCRRGIDDGYSGRNFDCPGWKQLIADIKNGIVEKMIVKDMLSVRVRIMPSAFLLSRKL